MWARALKEIKRIFDKLGIEYWIDWGTLLGAVRGGKIIEWDHDIDLGTMNDSWKKIVSAFPKLQERGFYTRFTECPLYKDACFRFIHIYGLECELDIWPYQENGENASIMRSKETNLISRGLIFLYHLLLSQNTCCKPRTRAVAKVLKHCLSLLPPKSKESISDLVWLVWRRSGVKFFSVVIPKHHFEKLGTIRFYGMRFNIPSDVEDYLKYHYGEDWKIPKREWDWLKDDGAVRRSV